MTYRAIALGSNPRFRARGQLPLLSTTSAWMESAIKEINFRTKGTEMFWNKPSGAEAILQIRAASLCDDDRLARLLSHRPGCTTLRRPTETPAAAA